MSMSANQEIADPTPSAPLRASADVLRRAARPAFVGVSALGLLAGVAWAWPTASFSRAFGPLVAGLFLGWLIEHLLRARAAQLAGLAEHLDATGRIEQHMAAGFERIVAALTAIGEAPHAARATSETRAVHLIEIRHAIRNANWADAETRLSLFAELHADDPDVQRISTELASAKQTAGQDLLARIEAAREVNDPERVIELRESLRPLIADDALHALDRDLAKWFMQLIHRRLRAGTARADVVALATRVADNLGETLEGASLRASLPTLRRAAGLCSRCGQPYNGIAEACPRCLGVSTPAATSFEVAEEDELETQTAESPFLDPDDELDDRAASSEK